MKNKGFFTILIFIFFYSFSVAAQHNFEIDSLIGQISAMPDNNNKVNTILRISLLTIPQSISMDYAQRAEKLANKLNYSKGVVNSLLLQTRIFSQKGKLDSAIIKINTSLSYLETDTSFPQLLAKTNFYAGNVYNELNNYNKATIYYLKALQYYKKTNSVKVIPGLLNNLGMICIALDNNEKGIEYLEKAKTMLTNRSRYYISILSNLGIAYKNIGNNKQALDYYLIILKIEQKALDSIHIAKTYNGIGIVYKNMKDYDKAFDNLYKALEIKEKLGNPKYIASTLNNIADIKLIKQDYHSAIELSKRSYKLASSVGAKSEKLYALENIFKGFEQLGNYKEALLYYKLYYSAKDSAFYNNAKSKNLIYKYEIKAKNNKIKLQEAENQNKTYFIVVLTLIIIITIVIVYFWFNNQKNKNLRKIIQTRAEEAESQKRKFAKELHDSIGSYLTGIRLQLLAMKDKPTVSNIILTEVITEVERTHQGIRLLAYQASPPEFDNYTVDEAISNLVQRLTKTGSIKIHFSSAVTLKWLMFSNDFQLTIYRIVQEALSNVIKHSKADNVDIQIIQHETSLNIMIEDNGQGFDVYAVNKGLGFRNIKERTGELKGIFRIDSTIGKGTSIIIDLPIPNT